MKHIKKNFESFKVNEASIGGDEAVVSMTVRHLDLDDYIQSQLVIKTNRGEYFMNITDDTEDDFEDGEQ